MTLYSPYVKFIKTFCIYLDLFSIMGIKMKYRKLKEAIFVKHIHFSRTPKKVLVVYMPLKQRCGIPCLTWIFI